MSDYKVRILGSDYSSLQKMGMKQPQHTSAFITRGRIDNDTVIDKYMA